MDALGGSSMVGNTPVADWRTLMFKSEEFIEENCRLAPRTTDRIRGMPGFLDAFNNRFCLFIVHRGKSRAPDPRGGRGGERITVSNALN